MSQLRNRLVLAAIGVIAAVAIITGQSISIPNTFVNGTTADATQVNANFTALSNGALNRAGGTMTGTLNALNVLPVTDNTYALGSASFKWKLPFIAGGTAGQFLQTDGAGTTSWATVATATVTAKSTTYTAVAGDFVEATGTFTVTLPAAASNTNRVIDVKNVSTGVITVQGNGVETIDGSNTYLLSTRYQSVTLLSNGTSWDIR